MNKYFLLLVIALGFLAVVFNGFVTFESNRKASLLILEHSQIDKNIDFFEYLLSSVIEAQSGVRGFVASGDDLYLESYDRSLALWNDPKTDAFWSENIKDDPSLAKLRTEINEMLAFLHEVIESYRSQGLQAVLKKVAGGSGKTLMDNIRLKIEKIVTEKKQRIEGEEIELTDQLKKINFIANVGSGIAFLLTGFYLISIYTYATRSEKEKKVLFSLEKLRNAIMENSREVILTLDTKGMFTSCNKLVERITGFPPSKIIGTSLLRFIRPEDDEFNLKNFSKKYSRHFGSFAELLLFAKDQPVEEDIIWTLQNNERAYFQASIAPLIDADGTFTGYLVEGNEITERVKLNEKLIEARAEAENANRSKSQFLASMSHDLRTPLNAIIGYTDILQNNVENNLSKKQFIYLKRVEENTQHLLEMIQDLMTLEKIESRKETIQFSEVRVGNLIEQIFQEVELRAAKKGITLKAEGLEGSEPLHTDEQKLYRILANLITNAVKFTEKGSVRVVVTQDKQTHQPIRIDVVDTGIGIDTIHQKDLPTFFSGRSNVQKRGRGKRTWSFDLQVVLSLVGLLYIV